MSNYEHSEWFRNEFSIEENTKKNQRFPNNFFREFFFFQCKDLRYVFLIKTISFIFLVGIGFVFDRIQIKKNEKKHYHTIFLSPIFSWVSFILTLLHNAYLDSTKAWRNVNFEGFFHFLCYEIIPQSQTFTM